MSTAEVIDVRTVNTGDTIHPMNEALRRAASERAEIFIDGVHYAPVNHHRREVDMVDRWNGFERADHMTHGRADEFIKWVLAMRPVAYETGDVECPVGYVQMVNAECDLIAAYVSEAGDPWMSEARNFTPGWYIFTRNGLGLVYGYAYKNDTLVGLDFIDAGREYERWLEAVS